MQPVVGGPVSTDQGVQLGRAGLLRWQGGNDVDPFNTPLPTIQPAGPPGDWAAWVTCGSRKRHRPVGCRAPRLSKNGNWRSLEGKGDREAVNSRLLADKHQGVPPAAAVAQKPSLAETSKMAKVVGEGKTLERGGLER